MTLQTSLTIIEIVAVPIKNWWCKALNDIPVAKYLEKTKYDSDTYHSNLNALYYNTNSKLYISTARLISSLLLLHFSYCIRIFFRIHCKLISKILSVLFSKTTPSEMEEH